LIEKKQLNSGANGLNGTSNIDQIKYQQMRALSITYISQENTDFAVKI